MHQIHELFLTLMTWWFQHTGLFQNEVMPLLHGTLQLSYTLVNYVTIADEPVVMFGVMLLLRAWCRVLSNSQVRARHIHLGVDTAIGWTICTRIYVCLCWCLAQYTDVYCMFIYNSATLSLSIHLPPFLYIDACIIKKITFLAIMPLCHGLFSRDLHILDLWWRLPLCALRLMEITPLCTTFYGDYPSVHYVYVL